MNRGLSFSIFMQVPMTPGDISLSNALGALIRMGPCIGPTTTHLTNPILKDWCISYRPTWKSNITMGSQLLPIARSSQKPAIERVIASLQQLKHADAARMSH